ncbi:MAG: hypothetical protein ACNYNX_04865 [Leucobacter sp.]
MASWKEPVGPKGKGVYLRRRILVLLGLLALVAAVVLIVLRPGSSGGATGAREVEVPDDLVQVEQQEQEQSSDPEAIAACVSGQLVVTPATDAVSYGPEDTPMLSLSIENRGDAECSADLGTAGIVFAITSGSDQIWLSTDCQQNPDHRAVILKPGEPLETEPIAWDRTRSGPDTCDIDREAVVAGGASYHLKASAAGVDSNSTAQFQLY